jgi:hypothetical protein
MNSEPRDWTPSRNCVDGIPTGVSANSSRMLLVGRIKKSRISKMTSCSPPLSRTYGR